MSELWLPDTDVNQPLVIADERIFVDLESERVYADDRRVRLSPHEFETLALLAHYPDEIVSYPVLSERVWGDRERFTQSASMKVTVSTMREKLGGELKSIRTGAIRNRRNLGYYAVRSLSNHQQPDSQIVLD